MRRETSSGVSNLAPPCGSVGGSSKNLLYFSANSRSASIFFQSYSCLLNLPLLGDPVLLIVFIIPVVIDGVLVLATSSTRIAAFFLFWTTLTTTTIGSVTQYIPFMLGNSEALLRLWSSCTTSSILLLGYTLSV